MRSRAWGNSTGPKPSDRSRAWSALTLSRCRRSGLINTAGIMVARSLAPFS